MDACDVRGLDGESWGGLQGSTLFPFCHSLSCPLALWGNYQEVNSFIQSWRSLSVHELGGPLGKVLKLTFLVCFVLFCFLLAIWSNCPEYHPSLAHPIPLPTAAWEQGLNIVHSPRGRQVLSPALTVEGGFLGFKRPTKEAVQGWCRDRLWLSAAGLHIVPWEESSAL